MVDCRKDWVLLSKAHSYCKRHKLVFDSGGNCSLLVLDRDIKDSNIGSSSNLSINGVEKGIVSGVPPPPYDNTPHTILSKRQQVALNYQKEGISISRIAELMKIKKSTAQDLLTRARKNALLPPIRPKHPPHTIFDNTPHTIRLHNDEFKLKISGNYSVTKGELKNVGKNLEYKLIKSDSRHIKIHKNMTMTVRFKESIYGKDEDACLGLADKRLAGFIEEWNLGDIQIVASKLLSRHYALLGTGLAKKVVDERKVLIVRDRIDGAVRLRIDFSPAERNPSGTPELEAEHVDKGRADIAVERRFHDDLINEPHYLQSEVKSKIDVQQLQIDSFLGMAEKFTSVMQVQSVQTEALTRQLEVHLPVEQKAAIALTEDAVIRKQTLELQREQFVLNKKNFEALSALQETFARSPVFGLDVGQGSGGLMRSASYWRSRRRK